MKLAAAQYGEGKTRGSVAELAIPATTNQALAAITFEGTAVELKAYVRTFLEQRYELTRKAASGGVQPNLNLGLVREIPVPIPPLREQQEILGSLDEHLSVLERNGQTVDAQLTRATRLRQAILKRAFEGKLVPQDPKDEPASALLARIRAAREAPARPADAAPSPARRGRSKKVPKTS